MQVMVWKNVHWNKTEDGTHLPETAGYVCAECGSVWSEAQRHVAVRNGRWEATRPFNGAAGFAISGMMSPWLSLGQMAREFLQSRHDPEKLKSWTNLMLGECYEPTAGKTDPTSLMSRRENYTPTSLPEAVRLITAAVDVQADRLELFIIGWAEFDESFAIAYCPIHGDPLLSDVWEALDILLRADSGHVC
jgi:phage terminase large subunit GpA-like protein